MAEYLLLLIVFTLCLGGVTIEGNIKQMIYILIAALGIIAVFGGNLIGVR